MRLHAAIFALSQGVPVFAIDYHVNGRGKVGQLFDDRGAERNAVNIKDLKPDHIVRFLAGVADSIRPGDQQFSAGKRLQRMIEPLVG